MKRYGWHVIAPGVVALGCTQEPLVFDEQRRPTEGRHDGYNRHDGYKEMTEEQAVRRARQEASSRGHSTTGLSAKAWVSGDDWIVEFFERVPRDARYVGGTGFRVRLDREGNLQSLKFTQ